LKYARCVLLKLNIYPTYLLAFHNR